MTTWCRVLALMPTDPGHAACSCEQAMVIALSEALRIDYNEALYLDGPPGQRGPRLGPRIDVREAIRNSADFSDAQMQTGLPQVWFDTGG